MKKTNKKLLVILVIAFTLLLGTIGVFAFYHGVTTDNETASTSIDADNVTVQSISSYADLFLYGKDDYENSSDVSSETRKILRLTENVTLEDDFILMADVHIDLGTKTLDLNEHSLTIQHGYAGCYSMTNGTVVTGTDGMIYIDLVKAGFVYSDITYGGSVYSSSDDSLPDCFTVLNVDSRYTAYSALYLIGQRLSTDLDSNVDFMNYSAVNAKDSSEAYTFDITSEANYIVSKDCSFDSGNTHTECSYVYKDLLLPFHYLTTDIEISYESTADAYLTDHGDLIQTPSTEADCTLTATVTVGDDSYSCPFHLHLINLSDTATNKAVGADLIKTFLSEYYSSSSSKYEINHGLELPLKALDSNITYSYSLYHKNADESLTEVTTSSGVSSDNSDVYILKPNDTCDYLYVSVGGANALQLPIKSLYVSNEETVARKILNKVYGGAIVFDPANGSVTLATLSNSSGTYTIANSGLTDDNLTEVNDLISDYDVTNISYAIKSGSAAAGTYVINSNVLTLSSSGNPVTKMKYITATFTFTHSSSETITVPVDLYITYLKGTGTTANKFSQYYSEYEKSVKSIPQIETQDLIMSFTMPFSYDGGTPYTCYDVSYSDGTNNYFGQTTYSDDDVSNVTVYNPTYSLPACLSVTLTWGSHSISFSYSSASSFTDQLDAELTTLAQSAYTKKDGSSLTAASSSNADAIASNVAAIMEDIAAYKAEYTFAVVAQGASAVDVSVMLVYNYKFAGGSEWQKFQSQYEITSGSKTYYQTNTTCSMFTVKSALYRGSTGTNAVGDDNFFVWIYNNFKPSGNTITTSGDSSERTLTQLVIPKEWLGKDVALDVTKDSSLSSVTTFSGINNLTSITEVNLCGVNLSSNTTILSQIAAMSTVTKLNLSYCSLSDISTICATGSAILSSLKTLYLQYNSISDFSMLTNFTALESVYVYLNTGTAAYYGSSGICNYQTYADLMRNGTSVYNSYTGTSTGSSSDSLTAVLYAESNTLDDYARLKALIYDSMLKSGTDIQNLYSGFQGLTVTQLQLKSNTSGSLSWGYGGGTDQYDATYFYVNYTIATGVVMNVKYYVDRY